MTVTMRPAAETDTNDELAPDAEWRSLVTEAALAAGMSEELQARAERAVERRRHLTLVNPEPGTSGLADAVRAHTSSGDFSFAEGRRAPSRAVPATLEGDLVRDARVYKTSSHVDVLSRELRMTCQVGQFSVHDAARSDFSPEGSCAFGAYNAVEAGIVASVPASELRGARSGRVTAKLCVPVSFDNTLQRVWRLAVPSRDMLLDGSTPHFAVVGLRGSIYLKAQAADGEVTTAKTSFLNRSLSAHAPSSPQGFGPVRGAHVLEVDVPSVDPARDLDITLTVRLASLIAGDVAKYRAGAPFYAGIDFGGNGTVRLPHECLSTFEIPLTPLIENQPISVSEIAFTEPQDARDD